MMRLKDFKEQVGKRLGFKKVMNLVLFLILVSTNIEGQYTISGVVLDENQNGLKNAEVFLLPQANEYKTDATGRFEIKNLPAGNYELVTFLEGYGTIQQPIELKDQSIELTIQLTKLAVKLVEVIVKEEKEQVFGLRKLKAVEGTAIYAGKKSEVVLLDQLIANLSANNARQIYAQIAGLNIYDTNDAGLQLSIGGRGLDPNRTANFNTRQNNYDISADVLGYPESYYSPPAEALEEVQIIRGAASLQYGTQFGGLVNFIFKKPNPNKKIEWTSRQSIGSNALFTSFNSLSGTIGNTSYYTYFNNKQGNGFRPNSAFESSNLFAHINHQFSNKTSLNLELTYLNYLAQQAGGLTDAQFYENPNFSNRSRNWFEVNWKLYALQFKHKFSPRSDFSIQVFGLDADRNALGFRTNRVSQTDDLNAPRDLIKGKFQNWGTEARFLHRYKLAGKSSIFLIGTKFYQSNNKAIQGAGTAALDADFSLQNEAFPNYANQSDFKFPNKNLAFFGEHILYLNDHFSVTPGFRFEYIKTQSIGSFLAIDFDLAGNPIRNMTFEDNRTFSRKRLLLGLGLSFKPSDQAEWYSNFSENYRSVTFNDIRTVNPSYQIDPNITDENGYNVDLGFRGQLKNLKIDINAFTLLYRDRLGEVLRPETRINAEGVVTETGRIIRFRGNIGKAVIYGIESLIDWNFLKPDIKGNQFFKANIFANTALTTSRYFDSEIAGVNGNKVEFIPLLNLKTGLGFGYKNLLASFQYTLLDSQFSDASNALQNRNDNQSGIIGQIPKYGVADCSFSYRFKFLKFESGINNLFNEQYFTRRATGYPGPGIIPSAPRTFYTTLEFKF